MTREEEISRAFEYGAKAFLDRAFPLPPEDWPESAKEEFRNGFDWCAQARELNRLRSYRK